MAFVCVVYETDEYYNITVEFVFEKTVKPLCYTRTCGSAMVIRMYVTFQGRNLTFVFCCLYCNEILTVKGNIHRDLGLPNNYCPVHVVCSH